MLQEIGVGLVIVQSRCTHISGATWESNDCVQIRVQNLAKFGKRAQRIWGPGRHAIITIRPAPAGPFYGVKGRGGSFPIPEESQFRGYFICKYFDFFAEIARLFIEEVSLSQHNISLLKELTRNSSSPLLNPKIVQPPELLPTVENYVFRLHLRRKAKRRSGGRPHMLPFL